MRRRRWMQHAGKYIAQTCRAHTELQRIHKMKRRRACVVFQFNRDQSPETGLAKHSLSHCLSFRRAEAGKIDATNPRMILQPLSQCASIFAVSIHSHCQRFHSTQNLVRFPGTQYAADEFHHANQSQAVGAVARNRNSAHCVRVSAQILGGAMYDDIRTMAERLTEIRRSERVVDDEPRADFARNFGTGIEVANLQEWIRDRFGNQDARPCFASLNAQLPDLIEVCGDGLDSERAENVL